MRSESPFWVRNLPALAAAGLIGILIGLPLADILCEALGRGPGAFLASILDPDTLQAAWLTAVVAAMAVVFNTVFGVAAAWAIAKHDFRGKALILSLIDLPFSVSPVVSGLVFVLLFGARSTLGDWLTAHRIRVLFAMPGIVLATVFVTFPFVAREVLPVMEAVGREQEEAALTLGASPWQTFRYVTLPGIRWGLVYGVLLCTSRAIGEFGAVSVVSGRITGETDTLSLRVEKLYQGYQAQAAFAVSSLFLLLALATLVLKSFVEWRLERERAESARMEEAR